MSFASPEWLLGGLLALGVAVLWLRAADRRRRRDLARIASPALLAELQRSVSAARRRIRRILLLLGIATAFVALARPEWGFTWTESKRRGIDVLIAVDVSRSMLARDVSPDRLTRAKLAVADLLEKLDGDRVGLIAFAGSAFLQTPLTLDEEAFRRSLEALEPGIIPRGGSDLASAIRLAVRAFQTEKTNFKILVMLSDGEDLAGEALAAAAEAAEQQVRIYTVGVGTPAGELIPAGDQPGRFVEQDGRIVKSRLDETMLREIAERTGAFYTPLGQRGEGVAEVYERALAPIPEEELASRMRRVPIERFQWPLALALLSLIAEALIGDRAGSPEKHRSRSGPVRASRTAAPLLLAAGLGAWSPTPAHSSPAEAQRLYDEGRFVEALAAYRAAVEANPQDPRLQLNLGAAAYKAGDHATAAAAFAAALRAEEAMLKERSFYNLGNAQYRLGEQTRETNPENTAQAWRQAIAAYEEALRIDAGDEDARFNLELVKRKLEELEQNPPPKPSPKPSPQPSPEPSSDPSPGEPGSEGNQGGEDGVPRSPSPGDTTPLAPPSPSPSGDASGGGSAPTPSPAASPGDPASPQGGSERGPEPPSVAEEPRPGQMSPREAAELLDSLAVEEPTLPAMIEAGTPPSPEDPERDW